jgi:hypothetical protein
VDAGLAALLGSGITGVLTLAAALAIQRGAQRVDRQKARRERLERAYLPLSSFLLASGDAAIRSAWRNEPGRPSLGRFEEMMALVHLFGSDRVYELLEKWNTQLKVVFAEPDESKLDEPLAKARAVWIDLFVAMRQELSAKR